MSLGFRGRIPAEVRGLLSAQLLARLPQSVVAILLLIHVSARTGSYGFAGLAVGVYSSAAAVGGPALARLLSTLGGRRTIALTTLCGTVALVVLALAPDTLVLVAAAIAGTCTPPIVPAVRSAYPLLVPAGSLARMFSLDSVVQEALWAVAPVLATGLVTFMGAAPALLAITAVGLLGGVLVARAPVMARLRPPTPDGRLGRVLLRRPVPIIIGYSLLLNIGYGLMQTGVVAAHADAPVRSGVLLALSALSSLVAGAAALRMPMSRWSLAMRHVPAVLGAATALAAAGDLGLGVAMVLYGMGMAPALAVMYSAVSFSLPSAAAAEVYGWLMAAMLGGTALGSLIGGAVIDLSGGVQAVFALMLAASASAVGLAALGRNEVVIQP